MSEERQLQKTARGNHRAMRDQDGTVPVIAAARRIRPRIAAPLPHHVPDRSPPGTGAAGWRVARPGRQR